MRRARVVGIVLVAGPLLASACSGGSSTGSGARPGPLVWHACGSIQCAMLSVPLDWAHPSGRHLTLALGRTRATGRRVGTLLTNPGGPGASGLDLVRDAKRVFTGDVFSRFDIVSWDPRGVGGSTPVRCADDLDFFFSVDHSPRTAEEVQRNVDASKTLVAGCQQRAGALLPYVSTRSTVRDMDAIRAALGEPTISYLGFSYGTYLGALYARQFPHRVRAMVLDGAVDPSVSYEQASLAQGEGFERALDAFLSDCARAVRCEFARGSDPRAAYDDLMAQIDAEPEPADVGGEARTLGPGEADLGVATALYGGREAWGDLAGALSRAARGDGSGLLELSDAYTDRRPGGRYGNENDAFYAIGCLDSPAPRTLDEVERLAADAARAAPRFGASTVWLGLPCTYWPVPPDGAVGPVRAPGAPPIVVIGTTDDPATPFAWAESLAAQLGSGHLLTYQGEGHTAYGRGVRCVDDDVARYLVSLQVPPAAARCS